MDIPSDYLARQEVARAIDPAVTAQYLAHTVIGDPPADDLLAQLAPLGPAESERFIQAGMDHDESVLRDAPPVVRDFFAEVETEPDWLDLDALTPGIRMFHRHSKLVLGGMVAGVLVEGFSTNISKSFFITGRVRDQGVRRLQQNNRQMVEIFMPAGLARDGDGWKLSVRVRLVHAQVRRLLATSDDWDHAAWGTPLSAAHIGYAISAFSARLLKHMKSLGARCTDEERRSFMDVWRYSGHLMGIPPAMLFKDEEDALRIFEVGGMCEPPPPVESVVLANSLVNSAPLVAGITDPAERRRLVQYVFRVSRVLIGDTLADQLEYPKHTTVGVLPLFRMQERYGRIMEWLFPRRVQGSNFSKFTSLLDVSMFDESGISYALPDHVYAEKSSEW
jgi:hypothetical protein